MLADLFPKIVDQSMLRISDLHHVFTMTASWNVNASLLENLSRLQLSCVSRGMCECRSEYISSTIGSIVK
jgi:hypothetical protein